jgi:hypothetical protein
LKASLALTAALATAAAAEPQRVSLHVLGDEAQTQAFTASLRELLSRLDVSLEPGEGPTLAAVEADFPTPHSCVLTVVDARGVTVLTRRFGDDVRSPALLAEAAAHVVQSVVDDLLHAAEPRRPAQPAPSDAPLVAAAAPPAEPEGSTGLEVGVFFGGRDQGLVSVGGGAAIGITANLGRWHPGLLVWLGYQAPIEVQQPFLSLSVQTFSPRFLLSLDVLRVGRFRLDGALGGGTDIFFIDTHSELLPMHGTHPPPFASPVLTAMLRGNVALASKVNLYLAATLDADLQPPNFVVREGADNVSMLEPWRFRPSLVLGFSFMPLGGAR